LLFGTMNSSPRTDTFLFTDLENSTPLWENHPALMQELAARHDALMRKVIEEHRGRVVKTTGDGFHAAFDAATDGVAAALAGQQAMVGEFWPAETGPLRVRMGLHTGESRPRDGDFYGSEVNRAARVMGLAYGGQVLVSGATARLVRNTLPAEVSLFDLGRHRLKGLASAERVYQVQHPTLPTEFPPLKSLSAYKHNLPVQLSTFVGREREVAEVKRLLQECHLLTLLGPGGTGKTRLMLEVAEEVIGDFTHGVWLVELAPLTDPDLIPERVAAALSIQEQPDRAMSETLVDYLRRKETLLLLDNVEHLIQECAELAQHLLTHCPKLKILVTGREALFIAGETTLQIPSLSLPSGNGDSNLEEIRASEGVQLFVARAQDIHPDFELGPANAATIAEIVRRLDGIPLALELATARLRMLSVEQIAERLDDRFRLLTGGRRTALPRQQTLQAMIDWSWNLLGEKERLLLQRLSVFSGGWTLEAAQAVAGSDQAGYNRLDEYDVFDLLEQLVNKSLVTVNYPVEREARYGTLESIRQYGRDRLFESNEGSIIRNRHADYYGTFAEEAAPHLARSTMLEWTSRIKLELDNLRAVMAWTVDDRPELTLRIGGNLLYYEAHWLTPREGRTWLESAIERTRGLLDEEETKIRRVDFIKALIGLGVINGIQGRTTVALSLAEESIQLARSLGESRHVAYAIALKHFQNPFNMTREDMQELEEAIAISRENSLDAELGLSLMIAGIALDAQGKPELAMPYFQEVAEIYPSVNTRLDSSIFEVQTRLARSQGNLEEVKRDVLSALEGYEALNHRRAIAMGQSAMAHLLRQEGNLEEAEYYYRQSITGWQELGHRSAVAHQIECLAYIAIVRGEYEHAARLLGAAGSARQKLDALSEDPQEIQELTLAKERLAEAIGEKERDKVMAAGKLIDLDSAVEIALRLHLRPDGD
jgi:predicted ATPase/class 3 adenylate cyclase